MRKGIALALLVLGLPSAQAGSFAVRAAQLDLGEGRLVANGILLIEWGKISAAGANVAVPPEMPTVSEAWPSVSFRDRAETGAARSRARTVMQEDRSAILTSNPPWPSKSVGR